MAKHIIDDSPEGLAVLLSRKHGSGDDMAPTHGRSDALPAGLEDAMHDFAEAAGLHGADTKAMALAFRDAMSLGNGEASDDTDEGPTDEE